MKITSGHFVFLLLAGALGWWGYSTWSEHRAKVAAETQRQLKLDFAVAALDRAVAKHNAIANWAKDTPGRFSIDLQKVLVNPEGRPIVVDGMVSDIARMGDRYFISIHVPRPTAVDFILDCDAELANRLSAQLPANTSCAIIARISSVEKTAYKLSSVAQGGEASVEVDSADRFIARGRCLEWVNREQ
jgi:hypothetical protein